ncbi:MAG TPA: hypothetical protein VF238_02195, partial [Methylomirabilota bacterium]
MREGITPVGGGLPLFNGDQLMGAIGCSGGTAGPIPAGTGTSPTASVLPLSLSVPITVRCATLPAL